MQLIGNHIGGLFERSAGALAAAGQVVTGDNATRVVLKPGRLYQRLGQYAARLVEARGVQKWARLSQLVLQPGTPVPASEREEARAWGPLPREEVVRQ